MRNYDAKPYMDGQKLLYCPPGTRIQTVTFVSLGPRVGTASGKRKNDAVTLPPKTAIVRDMQDNLLTVNLDDLKPIASA